MARTASQDLPQSYPVLTSPSGKYYVQCIRTWQGDSAVWWAPDRNGYTFRLDKAGVYDEDEARRIERIRGEEWAVPVEIAEAAATRHVTGQDLRDAVRAVGMLGVEGATERRGASR
jgi:hypothetical protein